MQLGDLSDITDFRRVDNAATSCSSKSNIESFVGPSNNSEW
jgi:hypothetical protein